ncbi:MAG: hypothetical protein ACE5F8_04680, partial [Woeseiaceae bacterium]
MKNLLLILLLANILYFIWGWFAGDEIEPGVEILNESELGPPLTITDEHDENVIASVGAVLGSGEPSDLEAVVGRSCVTIGPFGERDDADIAETQYAGEGMRVRQRSTMGQIFVGHWVQIRNIPSRDESNRMLRVLKEGGLTDAYPVETEDEGLKISLGLFGNLDSAERIELEAKSLGFAADIAPRLREGTVYFVDVGLPP